MSSIGGNWWVIIDSPMGRQPLWADLRSDGEKLTGTAKVNSRIIGPDIFDGGISGDVVSWKMKVKKPVPLTMKLTLTHSSDKLRASTDRACFGTFPAAGSRVS